MTDIKGIDYNTQREKLRMPEYGREIQKMVDYAISLPTKEERLKCAKAIIRLMETRNPQVCTNNNDEQQTLWDHLYLISDKRLDIDWPCDVTMAEKFLSKPQPVPYNKTSFRLRHYGRLLDETFQKLKTMAAGPERDELVRLTANQMKRDLVNWGHGSTANEKVADDLARLTDGIIQIDINDFRFEETMAQEPNFMPKKKGKNRK